MNNTQQQPQGLYDIYDLLFTPFWRTTPFLVTVACITGLCLSYGAWRYWKKMRSRPRTPWEEAQMRLDELRAKVTTTDANILYASITDTLKKYLERRYSYQLLEKTEEEIVVFLSTSAMPDQIKNAAQEIFSRAVAYKFGNAQESVGQMVVDVQNAKRIILQTMPQEAKGAEH